MTSTRRRWRAAALLSAALALPGCAAVALSAVGPAAEFGLDQATSGITAKTYTAPAANLRLATLKSLSRMDMDVVKDTGADKEWTIEAKAGDRSIEIELKTLTAMTTRIRVVADNGNWFFHDEATAEEVVAQITEALERDKPHASQAAMNDTGDMR
ncbi:MAG TPA: DUF3568 family protein [Alphaproteobacteria bacterium]|nr:DUF3568 family protein [Alphaproteobacteria bacterium]